MTEHDANADEPSAAVGPPAIEAVWAAHRRRLLDIGYRMLGTVSDAEDVVGEAYARLVAVDLDAIDDVVGWLVTVTSRLCIDRLRSAEHQRRAYVGPWLPEPILTAADESAVDPADRVTLDDSVRMALLVVLEQLTPAERTSLVLHDFFAVSFDEIAELVGRSPAACRQLASRARRRIQADQAGGRTSVTPAELDAVARRFAEACEAGAIEALLEVLDPNVVGDFDSGGVIPGAPLRPIDGAPRVARLLANTFSQQEFVFSVAEVNGEPGVVARSGGQVVVVGSIGVGSDGRIVELHAIGNPAKLRHLTA